MVSVETDKVILPVEPTDINDRHVLQALIASGADYLVTGDKKHLLSLGMKTVITASHFAGLLSALKSMAPAITPAQNSVSRIKKRRIAIVSVMVSKDKAPK